MRMYWPDLLHSSPNRSLHLWWVWVLGAVTSLKHGCELRGYSGRNCGSTGNVEPVSQGSEAGVALHLLCHLWSWSSTDKKMRAGRIYFVNLLFNLLDRSWLRFKNVLYWGLIMPNTCISKMPVLQIRQERVCLREVVLLSWNWEEKRRRPHKTMTSLLWLRAERRWGLRGGWALSVPVSSVQWELSRGETCSV